MRKLLIGLTFLLCAGCNPTVRQVQVGELQQREAICGGAQRAFDAADVKVLEAQSSAYRSERSRTPSGVWKLSMFYCGIEKAIGAGVEAGPLGARRVSSTIDRWESLYPSSPAPHIARTMSLIDEAWQIRGTTFAYKVPADAWKPFNEGIEAARQNLEKYKAVSSSDPTWYDEMATIATTQSWDRPHFDALIDEGLSKEPSFYAIYFAAFTYFLPKWNGDVDQLDDFVSRAVDLTANREGKGMYARIYWYASQAEFGDDLFEKSRARWPLMKAGFEDVIASYPDEWNVNNYAKFACMAGDKETTARLLKQISSHVVPSAWSDHVSYSNCLDWTKNVRATGRTS